MKTFRIIFCLVVGAMAFAPNAHAQAYCETGTPVGANQVLRGAAISFGTTEDVMQCGRPSGPTPTTCQLHNRVYSMFQSCVNADVGSSYFPTVYRPNNTSQRNNYQTSSFTTRNWPQSIGLNGQTWVAIWDHFAGNDADSADCAGYYGAQSDIVEDGEIGDRRLNPCKSCVAGAAQCVGSCWNQLTPTTAEACSPITNTRLGDLTRIGSLAPVPVPRISGVVSNAATNQLEKVTLDWQAACNSTTSIATDNSVSREPLYGYILEVAIDRLGDAAPSADGQCDPPTGCDADSDVFIPFLEISPDVEPLVGIPHLEGDTGTTTVDVELVAPSLVSNVPVDEMECLTFRLRVEFIDDRLETQVGGADGIIDGPIASLPGLSSPPVANQALAAFISSFVGRPTGDGVDLTWGVGSATSFSEFVVSKSHSRNGQFKEVGRVVADSVSVTYSFTDSKARGNVLFYRLEALDGFGGVETATIAVPLPKKGQEQ